MRQRLQETERLAGIKPVGRPPREAEPEPAVPAEPAQPLANLGSETARVNQVYRWILEGATEYDIVEAVQQAWPDADHAKILLAAIDKIKESARIDPTTVAGFCVEATRDLYRRMVEIGDFPGALRAVRQLRDFLK
jgi:hypothetical protein